MRVAGFAVIKLDQRTMEQVPAEETQAALDRATAVAREAATARGDRLVEPSVEVVIQHRRWAMEVEGQGPPVLVPCDPGDDGAEAVVGVLFDVAEGTYVCDGCMACIPGARVAEWADGEHVLCRQCVDGGKW